MSGKQIDTNNFHMRTERAIDELRRQNGLILQASSGNMAFIPLESVDGELFSRLGKIISLIITGARAKSIGLKAGSTGAIQIAAGQLSFEQLCFLADPLSEKTSLPTADISPASHEQQLALTLTKYASLLPALLVIEGADRLSFQPTQAEDIEHYIATPLIEVIETASAHLPLAGAENARIISFRSRHSTAVHLALIVGDIHASKNPITRIHSSCVTGDILGSLRCDCGDQLQLALKEITTAGNGILIYLHQEGRGIGITNKLRAYALQEKGVDTYDANLMLGFDEDERDFAIAAAILKKLGVKNVRLLTNNPQKMKALEKQGIIISERLPLVVATGKHNHSYLTAKAKKSGHLF